MFSFFTMAADNTEQEAKLIGLISRTYQEAWNETIGLITSLEDYLETKYNMDIDDLEHAPIYQDPKTGEILVAKQIRIPANTLDFHIIDFLKKSRIVFADLAKLQKLIKKLPTSAKEIAYNSAPLIQAKANALLKISETELKGFKNKTRNEKAILKIATDTAAIQKYAHTLMEMSLSKRAAA